MLAAAVTLAAPVAVGSRAVAATSGAPLSFAAVVPKAAFPTNLAVAPDGRTFVAERVSGRIRVLEPSGRVRPAPFATLPVDAPTAQTGVLALALPPDFDQEPWVYAYYSGADGRNHLVRMRAGGEVAGAPEELLRLPSAASGSDDAGDLAFANDDTLFLSVGDGGVPANAQDRSSLRGKILRLNDDGSIPADNPFAGSPVYALGIRNSLGLCVSSSGALWSTDNGARVWDELNRVERGANLGWPIRLGPGRSDGLTPPVLAWRTRVDPTGCVVNPDGSLYVGDLHGDLHRVAVRADSRPTDAIVAAFDAGITDVERAPNGRLLVATTHAIYLRTGAASGPFTPAGVLVFAGLIVLLLLARRRLERR